MSLDDRFEQMIEDYFDQARLAFILILYKLKQNGISLNEEQQQQLRAQIQSQSHEFWGKDDLHFETDDGFEEHVDIELNVSEEDFARVLELIQATVPEALQVFLDKSSKAFLQTWKELSPRLLNEQREKQNDFNQRLRDYWGESLDLLDILISTTLRAGAVFNQTYRSQAAEEQNLIFEVLSRLHARGCQVAREIHILLSNGFADGASARWRTLHEIAVTANFIKAHGNDVAERYLLHSRIEGYKSALEYKKHCDTFGFEQLTNEELGDLKSVRDELIERFGPEFEKDYGWAANVLQIKRPTFADLERNCDFEPLRLFVKLAHSNIHASSNGILYRLGLAPFSNNLLAGPGLYGLGDPGRNTGYSLMVLTMAFLLLDDSIDHLAFVLSTALLSEEIYQAFYSAEDKLEHDMERREEDI